jgi:type II restriction enzyme
MVRFKELGFESFEEYINSFFSTLMPSNKTYEYFVDWQKVRRDVQKYVKELSLLNSLTKISSEKKKRPSQRTSHRISRNSQSNPYANR